MSKLIDAGIVIPGIVQLIFVLLKLFNVLDWSWWWVFSPVLIVVSILILIFAILGFIIVFQWEL